MKLAGAFSSVFCVTHFLALALLAFPSFATNGLPAKPSAGPFLDARLPSTAPVVPSDFEIEVAFTNLTFQNPMGIIPVPGTNLLAVWEREGKIWTFPNDPGATEKTLILDLTIQCQGWGSSGIFGAAFHPGFQTNRLLFVYYTWVMPGTVQGDMLTDSPEYSPGNYRDRLSRFTLPLDGIPSLDDEVILIDQITDSTFHSGGSIFFHPVDGFLYWCNGDDSRGPTQIINEDLLSGVFRLDVDQRGGAISHPIRKQPARGFTANYYIPSDNPFVGMEGVLEEFYALGLRNPYRMSIDKKSLRIFIGDVGNNSREEINTIEPADPPGLNFQWSKVEGSGGALTAPYLGTSKSPLLDYQRTLGGCIVGGFVYRGTEFQSELGGRYVFGDNKTTTIWALDESAIPPKMIQLATFPLGAGPAPYTMYLGLSSFGLDQNGEILMCQLSTTAGRILKLVRRKSPPVQKTFPQLLSETGVFENTPDMVPSTNLIAYDVNSPLWSDGAGKGRWFTIPKNTTIGFSASGEWQFPAGSVFVKHFELPTGSTDPAQSVRRLETRIIVRSTAGGVFGATYKWRPDNSDADLLETALDESITIETSEGTRTQNWHYPSQTECLQCHTPASQGVLGLNTRQLNRDFQFDSETVLNQLKAYNNAGMFFPTITETNFPSFAKLANIADSTVSPEIRVRSYLDSNCSHCHHPGEARAFWDARFETPMVLAGILNGTIGQSFNIPNAKTIVPGHPDKSIILKRIASLEPAVRMPPIAKNMLDHEAIAVLSDYIASLPETTNSLPGGWQVMDIGTPSRPGSVTFSSDALSLSASDGAIWGTADSLSFAHQQLNGDGEILAKIASSAGHESAQVGLMIRSSLDATSAHAFMSLFNRRGLYFCYRTSTSGHTAAAIQSAETAPVWLRLTREGNQFTGFWRREGEESWTLLGSINIAMPAQVYVGVAAAGVIGTSDFVVNNISTINAPPLNVRPSIQIETVISEGGAVAGPLLLRTSVADADGQPTMVEFFDGFQRIGQATSIPFEFLANASPGEHAYSARVYDNLGATASASATAISVESLTVAIAPSDIQTFHVSHRGNPGIPYLAEGSTNLLNWFPVGEAVASPIGTVSFDLQQSVSFRFFRVRPK